MAESLPAIALLFDDAALGGQLRAALAERGARIVHEGGIAGLTRELVEATGADVLVINLDGDLDTTFDRLDAVVAGDRPRVVFNDADASRGLEGWDRARWARHLAVKVLEAGDLDPPRPADARAIEPQAVAEAPPEPVDSGSGQAPGEPAFAFETESEPLPESGFDAGIEPDPVLDADAGLADGLEAAVAAFDPEVVPDAIEAEPFSPVEEPQAGTPLAEAAEPAEAGPDDLAAELEALLADGELDFDAGDDVGGLRQFTDADLPALNDGNFQDVPALSGLAADDVGAAAPAAPPAPVSEPTLDTSHLTLEALPDDVLDAIPAATLMPDAPSVSVPDDWALVDDATAVPDAPAADDFGIEKISAADYLAPEGASAPVDIEPTMSLELVSMEEAVAPEVSEYQHEMVLDELGSALSGLVVLGASGDGMASVCDFLAALPAGCRQTFLLALHLDGGDDADVLAALEGIGTLPLRSAGSVTRAVNGEVLLVPREHGVRVRRDGSILLSDPAPAGQVIDASFKMAAEHFGRHALGLVFSGRGDDALAGARAIREHGGEVWVETASGDYHDDMVGTLLAEHLASHSGAAQELAARLTEVHP